MSFRIGDYSGTSSSLYLRQARQSLNLVDDGFYNDAGSKKVKSHPIRRAIPCSAETGCGVRSTKIPRFWMGSCRIGWFGVKDGR
jgi:hypothetical protein